MEARLVGCSGSRGLGDVGFDPSVGLLAHGVHDVSAQMDMSPKARLERLRLELDRAAEHRKHHRKRANWYEAHRAKVLRAIADLETRLQQPEQPGTD